jgi:non-lysosomal glucosylceramidase
MLRLIFCIGAIAIMGLAMDRSILADDRQIMAALARSSDGRTPVVKEFPDSFPGVLTARGEPLVYTRENSKNFEYIGMPAGGIGAGQLYLGGDGKLWFWDIFNLNYKMGQLKGEEAYQYPYVRSKPTEKGARVIEQGFAISVKSGDREVRKRLDREGIEDISFLGQYPIGEVRYRDPELSVDVKLEAFSPFVPLDVDSSLLPATIMQFTVKNVSAGPVDIELVGWLENAVLTGSREQGVVPGHLTNRVTGMAGRGLRLECSAQRGRPEPTASRPDIPFEDFEAGYDRWTVSGDAFRSNGKPYRHDEPLQNMQGKRLADSMWGDAKYYGDEAQGKLISRPFTIERTFLTCRIGGGNHRAETCLNVLVDGEIVASATGRNSETLEQVSLDLRAHEGKQATIEIVDAHSANWGHVLVDEIVFTDSLRQQPFDNMPDHGTMALSVLGEGVFGRARMDYGLDDIFADGVEDAGVDAASSTKLVGTLGRRVRLQPGKEQEITFILSWHFPMARVGGGKRRHYAGRFEDASAVAAFVERNFSTLVEQTRLWRDTWYDSTLPYWFLDRTLLNASILASSTSHFLDDGRFYGFEGGYQGDGTCTHVWGYVQAMGRLFPQLEISLREKKDFVPRAQGGAMNANGVVEFRGRSNGLAVDGQASLILRTYLAHQMSKDDAFLRRNYAGMKKAMQGLTGARDADHDGILTGPQHNTLDADWYGKVTWLSLHYTAALRAAAEMADEMGDRDYSAFCQAAADKGRAYIESKLFNGEYFFHEPDPKHPNSPGIYTGCEYSQLLGQSWAYQVGLGEILDPVKARTALESIWRYSFSTDVGPFRAVNKGGRWYAMPGEGGLIACTWPRGGSEVLGIGNKRLAEYNNECQNGYEYACTSLMMWHGMPYHSLAHIWYLHNDRYHGSKRNPWCEVEWGCHYSRSMASYGHFIGACGFEYHGPKGYVAFAPKITPDDFKAPFVCAEGWGTYRQESGARGQESGFCAEMAVKWGKLRVRTLALAVPESVKGTTVTVEIGGKPATHKVTRDGERLSIGLAQDQVVGAGESVTVAVGEE